LVNVVYKEHWGRPRPEHVTAFGGDRPFLRVLQPGSEPGHSFPSGHAAAGFYLIGPAFLIYRRRPRLAAALFVMGLMAGTTIGLGRIIQGRHFASDVLWSAGIVYFTALGLDYLRALFPMPATVATPWRRGTANRGRPIAHDASTATKPTPAEPRRRDAA
jgi:membrane-associated PAP2 superfamily phosphatase